MNKKFLAAVAVALCSAFAAPVFAQNACHGNACKGDKCKTEKCEKGKCAKADCKTSCEQAECKQVACPFENLNLTDAQKVKIKALNEKRRAQAKDAREKKNAVQRDGAKQCRADYLAELKQILTPEQYVKYLENAYSEGGRPMPQGKPGMHQGMKNMKHAKGDCKAGECPKNKK